MRPHVTRNHVRAIGRFAANSAGKRVLRDVHTHVTDEIVALREFPAAYVAREGRFMPVDVEVFFEFQETRERIAADGTCASFRVRYGFIFTNAARGLLWTTTLVC